METTISKEQIDQIISADYSYGEYPAQAGLCFAREGERMWPRNFANEVDCYQRLDQHPLSKVVVVFVQGAKWCDQ